jgi:hypothetical protein
LTVKAQQMGLGVSEVPSSWTDRSAGQSNFKLWKWLPNYLHWFWVAMRQPLACTGLALLLATAGLVQAPDSGQRSLIALLFLVTLSVLLLARRLRTRWLAPVLVSAPSLLLLLAAVPSGALLLATRPRRQS